MDPRLSGILDRLRASGFAEVKGARASLSIPVSEAILNELITAARAVLSGPSRVASAAGVRAATRPPKPITVVGATRPPEAVTALR